MQLNKLLWLLIFNFTCLLSFAQQPPVFILSPPETARIHFEKTTQSLGKIEEGKTIQTAFRFMNSGDVPLSITKVNTSCDCTVAGFPKSIIAPGETSEIVVSYKAKNRPGKFVQSISVVYNSDRSPELLTLEGEVIDR